MRNAQRPAFVDRIHERRNIQGVKKMIQTLSAEVDATKKAYEERKESFQRLARGWPGIGDEAEPRHQPNGGA